MSKPVNLVLSGGGVNMVGHIGALIELSKHRYLDEVKNVVCSSAGSVGLGVVLDFKEEDYMKFYKILSPADLLYAKNGYLGEINRFYSRFGRYSGKKIRDTFNAIINEKTGLERATFADFHRMRLPELHVIATNMTRGGKKQVFCFENTPETCIADAFCASMAAPLYFEPVRMKLKKPGQYVIDAADEKSELFSDGALVNNFALEYFDFNGKKNPATLGLLLTTPNSISWIQDEKPSVFVKYNTGIAYTREAVRAIALNQKLDTLQNANDFDRVILISDLGNEPFNFAIDEKMKKQLLDSGGEAARNYLVKTGYTKPMIRAKL